MTRTENDLRAALRELEQRADRDGGPSTASILAAGPGRRGGAGRRLRWAPPVLAAATVAAGAVAVSLLVGGGDHDRTQVGGKSSVPTSAAARVTSAPAPSGSSAPTSSSASDPASGPAAGVLEDAAARFDAAPTFVPPDPQQYFYVRTTDASYWTSVSGRKEGVIRTMRGDRISVSACVHGKIVATGEEGTCTLIGTPHYLADAPTTPAAWDDYLERIAPGAKAADAQGKIVIGVFHDSLVAPRAAAALLRYVATSCLGLKTLTLAPVDGHDLVGVTCTSMTNGSYGLAFDATTHAFAGFAPVDYQTGTPQGDVEVVLATGIVSAVGERP